MNQHFKCRNSLFHRFFNQLFFGRFKTAQNMVRTRIGFSEYTQWVPTYGNSGDCSRYGVLLFQ